MNLQFGARLITSPDSKLFKGAIGRQAEADVTAVMSQLNTAKVSDDVVVWVNRETTGQGEVTFGLNAALADAAMNQNPQSVFENSAPAVFAKQKYYTGLDTAGERAAEAATFVQALQQLDTNR